MCQSSKLDIISQNRYGHVGYCSGCNRYNLIFLNIFLLLENTEIQALSKLLEENIGVYWHSQSLGNGKQISINTPLPNLYLAFTPEEFDNFKTLIIHTILVMEARNLVANSQVNPFSEN
jgi:hypothetical protein